MDTLVSSVSDSLRQVSPAAVPPLLDCVLASSGASPSSLFASLLDAFPPLIEVRAACFRLHSFSGEYPFLFCAILMTTCPAAPDIPFSNFFTQCGLRSEQGLFSGESIEDSHVE